MLRKLSSLLAILTFLALSTTIYASPPLDLSTGVNVGLSGNPLFSTAPGTRDDYWMVLSVLGAAQPPNTKSWIRYINNSWNYIPGTLPIYGNNDGVGTTEYERCFCLTDLNGAKLDIAYRADNKANFFLNQYFGNPILTTPTNDTFNPARPMVTFQYTAQNGLKIGKNCMRVRVNNEGGPTGFALKATLNAVGAQDTFKPNSCCQAGAPVFNLAFRVMPGGDGLTPVKTGAAAIEREN